MALGRAQRLRQTRPAGGSIDVALSPEEYFVLSRVEGSPTVADVLASSGLSADVSTRILDKLLGLGLVEIDPTPRPVHTSPAVRERAQTRRRQLLAAQLAGSGAPTPPDARPAEAAAPSVAAPRGAPPSTAPEPEDEEDDSGIAFDVPLVPADDPRIDPTLAIDVEHQRWVLALADGRDRLTPFEFLGLLATHDERAIRRAFHETSRKLHPDAYYGRSLGRFGPILGELFQRAKFYHAELRKPDVREPYVDRVLEEQAEARRRAEADRERERVVKEIARTQQDAEAALRRQDRVDVRTRRERDQLRDRLQRDAVRHAEEAGRAAAEGNLARAANLYRLALGADPDNEGYRARWHETRDAARRKRAAEAFAQALRHMEYGQVREATPLFVEAAEAHGTLEHLAHAADAVGTVDPVRARNFALGALDALNAVSLHEGTNDKRKPAELATYRVLIGRAFLTVGQKETAKQQALLAQQDRPEDPEVRALLKSLKLK